MKRVKRPVIDPTRESEDHDCCICMEKMEKVNCCTTRCGHEFCLTCFVRHSKGDIYAKCPLCRTTITDGPVPPPPPPPIDDDYIALDDDDDLALDFLPTLSFLQSLIHPVTREEREVRSVYWHT